MRIISLSTIPPRFRRIGPTLASLVSQRCGIDEIRVYVPKNYRRFPDYDGSLPEVPAGVRIVRSDTDLGPATKVLFAARELRGTDATILFCDDDRVYSPGWAAELIDAQKARPGECVALVGKDVDGNRMRTQSRQPRAVRSDPAYDFAFRARRFRWRLTRKAGADMAAEISRRAVRRAGYADLFQGWGGVVVRPDFFDDTAFGIPPILWAVDDVWLSGMLARRGIPIWLPSGPHNPLKADAANIDALKKNVLDGATRAQANAQGVASLQDTYGIWR